MTAAVRLSRLIHQRTQQDKNLEGAHTHGNEIEGRRNRGKSQSKGRVKVGKLNLNKETVKDLTANEQKQLKGGVAARTKKCGDFPRTVDTACNCA